jgi:hypothetical protein
LRRPSIAANPENATNRINLDEKIRRRFARFGGVELELPLWEPAPPLIEFGDDPEEGAYARGRGCAAGIGKRLGIGVTLRHRLCD